MEEKTKSGFGTASLVLGIIGIVFSFIPLINYLAFILGFLALIFGIVCLVKKASKGQAIAGLILAIISLFMAYSMHQGLKTAVDEVSSAFDSSKAAIVNLNVGESTTKAAVLSTVYMLFADFIINLIFYL